MARQGQENIGNEVHGEGAGTIQPSIQVKSVTASRSYKINTGNYESKDIFNSVTYEVSGDVDMLELSERAKDDLDNLQALELNDTYDIVVSHRIDKSIVFDLIEE